MRTTPQQNAINSAESFVKMVQSGHQGLYFENSDIIDLKNIISARMIPAPSASSFSLGSVEYKNNLAIKYIKSNRKLYIKIGDAHYVKTITNLYYLRDAKLGSQAATVRNKSRILKLIFNPQAQKVYWERFQ